MQLYTIRIEGGEARTRDLPDMSAQGYLDELVAASANGNHAVIGQDLESAPGNPADVVAEPSPSGRTPIFLGFASNGSLVRQSLV